MATLSSLVSLVYTLSTGEKKYFTIKTGLNGGKKDYWLLYKLIEDQVPRQELKKQFEKKSTGSSFETACKYLFKLLLDALLELRVESDKHLALLTDTIKATLLFEKNLYGDCFDRLKSIREKARKSEMKLVEIMALKLEMQYHSNLNFSIISENELTAKQMAVQNLLNDEKKINQYNSLYKLLRQRIIENGLIKNEAQKNKLNDLVLSELDLVVHPASENIESKKLRLLFQSHYFVATNDYDSALRIFYELNTIFENQEVMLPGNVSDYISMLESVLSSLRTIGRHKDMDFFLQKLQLPITVPGYIQLNIDCIFFIYKSAQLLSSLQFKEALLLMQDTEKTLLKRIHLVSKQKQLEVFLYMALCCFSNQRYTDALVYIERVLSVPRQYQMLTCFRMFRILKLLIHHEMQYYDLLFDEIRSVKRGIKYKESNAFLLEKILVKYIENASISMTGKERNKLCLEIKEQFEIIGKSHYEVDLATLFDFKTWIEKRLLHRK